MNTPLPGAAECDRLREFDGQIASLLASDIHLRAYGELQAADPESPDRVLSELAAEHWRQHLAEQPGDVIALHHLAVIVHGQAIEASRAQPGSPDATKLWREAMRLWSALCREEAFWSQVEERWSQLARVQGTADRDARADRFDAGQWRAFRRKLPALLLLALVELARQTSSTDAKQAKRYMAAIRDSGFEDNAINQARYAVYAVFQPDFTAIERENTFDAAMEKLQTYAQLDDELPHLWTDMLELYVKWFDHLLVNSPDDHHALKRVAEEAQQCAARKDLHRTAKADPVVAARIVTLCRLTANWFVEQVNQHVSAGNLSGICMAVDGARKAAEQALAYRHAGEDLSSMFGKMSYYGVYFRLKECDSAKDALFAQASGIVEESNKADAGNPWLYFAQAQVEAVAGNAGRRTELLRKARSAAESRSDHSAMEQIEADERKGGLVGDRLMAKARQLADLGHYSEALAKAEQAERLSTDNVSVELFIGQMHMVQGNRAQAREYYENGRRHAHEQGIFQAVEVANRLLSQV